MKRSYYKDSYAHIFCNENVPCIVVKFSDIPRSSEHFQMVNKHCLAIIDNKVKEYIKLGLCYDARDAGPVLPCDVSYYLDDVRPLFKTIGIKYLAVIEPVRPITFLTFMPMFHRNGSRYPKINSFSSLKEAYRWLRKN